MRPLPHFSVALELLLILIAMEIKRIVFPVDFSLRATQSAPLVQAVARRFGATVELLHVLHYAPEVFGTLDYVGQAADVISSSAFAKWRQQKEAELADFAEHGWAGISVETVVESGEISQVVIEHARTADMIMMPTHGYGPFRRMLLGSNTSKVLHDAPCPVWTDAHADDPGAWRPETINCILCAVDLEDAAHDQALLKKAVAFAAPWQAQVELFHAYPQARPAPGAPPAPGEVLRDIRLRLAGAAEAAGIAAPLHVVAGWPVEALHELAVVRQPDLMIIGRGRHHGLGRLGSHAYAMIREARCPVLSIPVTTE